MSVDADLFWSIFGLMVASFAAGMIVGILAVVRGEVRQSNRECRCAAAEPLRQARTKLQSAEATIGELRGVLEKHYPLIAGRVIALQQLGETKAESVWSQCAKDFHPALAESQPSPTPDKAGGGE